jgi:hypothetical protein
LDKEHPIPRAILIAALKITKMVLSSLAQWQRGQSGAVLHIIHIMILLLTVLAKDTPKTLRWAMTRIALAKKLLVPPL